MIGSKRPTGFTLVELLVVMVIISVLLSIAAPRFMRNVDVARESALKSELSQLREALDHYHADLGVYPQSLSSLIEKGYLRSIPVDPITGSSQTWQVFPAPGATDSKEIYDVRSGAQGVSHMGEAYANW